MRDLLEVLKFRADGLPALLFDERADAVESDLGHEQADHGFESLVAHVVEQELRVLFVDVVRKELEPEQVELARSQDGLERVEHGFVEDLEAGGRRVLLEDGLHDLDAVDVVEEVGQVERKCVDERGQVLGARVLEDEEQQLLLDDVLVERADVRVDVLEEERLLRVGGGVSALELDQGLLQLDRVLVLLDLRELVLLGEESVDVEVVDWREDVFEVHVDQDHAEVVARQVQHQVAHEGRDVVRRGDGLRHLEFEQLLVLDHQLVLLRRGQDERGRVLLDQLVEHSELLRLAHFEETGGDFEYVFVEECFLGLTQLDVVRQFLHHRLEHLLCVVWVYFLVTHKKVIVGEFELIGVVEFDHSLEFIQIDDVDDFGCVGEGLFMQLYFGRPVENRRD